MNRQQIGSSQRKRTPADDDDDDWGGKKETNYGKRPTTKALIIMSKKLYNRLTDFSVRDTPIWETAASHLVPQK